MRSSGDELRPPRFEPRPSGAFLAERRCSAGETWGWAERQSRLSILFGARARAVCFGVREGDTRWASAPPRTRARAHSSLNDICTPRAETPASRSSSRRSKSARFLELSVARLICARRCGDSVCGASLPVACSQHVNSQSKSAPRPYGARPPPRAARGALGQAPGRSRCARRVGCETGASWRAVGRGGRPRGRSHRSGRRRAPVCTWGGRVVDGQQLAAQLRPPGTFPLAHSKRSRASGSRPPCRECSAKTRLLLDRRGVVWHALSRRHRSRGRGRALDARRLRGAFTRPRCCSQRHCVGGAVDRQPSGCVPWRVLVWSRLQPLRR